MLVAKSRWIRCGKFYRKILEGNFSSRFPRIHHRSDAVRAIQFEDERSIELTGIEAEA
jgi:hypothetical protein